MASTKLRVCPRSRWKDTLGSTLHCWLAFSLRSTSLVGCSSHTCSNARLKPFWVARERRRPIWIIIKWKRERISLRAGKDPKFHEPQTKKRRGNHKKILKILTANFHRDEFLLVFLWNLYKIIPHRSIWIYLIIMLFMNLQMQLQIAIFNKTSMKKKLNLVMTQ